ncbi:hypothetical protein GCM10028773_30770 [Spirosoma koreense]
MVSDVNLDGKPDLIAYSNPDRNVSVLLGTGTGSFGPQTTFNVGDELVGMVIADVNLDGRPDIITVNANNSINNISVLLGDGTGSFAAPTSFPAGIYPRSMVIADVNLDGKLDIVTANSGGNNGSLLLGDGAGSFGPPTPISLASNPVSLAVGDVNDDGKPDLICTSINNNTVSVLLGDGTGSFAAPTSFPTGIFPQMLVIADVNLDGKPDLIAGNNAFNGAIVSVLLGEGAGSFGPPTNFTASGSPLMLTVGDVNLDGKPDLITADAYGTTVSVLLGDGTGGFGPQTPFTVGSNPRWVSVGDVNGDGKPDIVTANANSNNVSVLLNQQVVAQPIRYVREGGSGDGSSWATASGDLQAMINAEGVQQVWVAQGTYKPTSTTNRNISFSMKNGVGIYGGFAPTGDPGLAQRAPDSFTTVLSGDIGTPGVNTDNSYHVVNNLGGLTSTALLDGFVITSGGDPNAVNAAGGLSSGGGMFNSNSSPTLINCLFINNVGSNRAGQGAGMANGVSNPVLINCSFVNNSNGNAGGGILNDSSNPVLINCSFVNNSAKLGGGICNRLNSSPLLINCSFSNNSATSGGGIANNGNPVLINCVFFGNGGANTIVGGTVQASYSLFESSVTGYTSGPGNLTTTTSPFVSTTDLQLVPGSPAINAGNSQSYTAAGGPPTDLAGNVRIQNGTIDMGAYELGLPTDLTPVVYARTLQVDGTTALSLVVDVFEINIAPTTAPLTVRITKDAKVTLSFDNSLTSVGGRSVQNSAWSFDATQPGYYQLSTTEPLVAGAIRSVGLTGVLTPTGTDGMISLSATVAGGGEDNLANNTDADKIEYFQQ